MNKKLHPRPAAMGYMCDAFYANPDYQEGTDDPLLLRCHDPATVRLVIDAPDDTYAIKRCQVCAEILRAREAIGATFEILNEEAL